MPQGQGGGLAPGGGAGVQDACHWTVPGIGQQGLGAAVLDHAAGSLQPGARKGRALGQVQAAWQLGIRHHVLGHLALQQAEGGPGRLLEPGPEDLELTLGPVGRQGRGQGPLHRRGAVQGRGQGIQLRGEGLAILGGPAQERVDQPLVGQEAQLPAGRDLHGFMHGGVIADARQPGQLGQAHGQGDAGAQGHAPGGVLQVRLHPGLQAPPAAQAEAQQGLGQVRVLAQVAVPDVGHAAALSKHFVQGMGDMDAGGRGHGAPKGRTLIIPRCAYNSFRISAFLASKSFLSNKPRL